MTASPNGHGPQPPGPGEITVTPQPTPIQIAVQGVTLTNGQKAILMIVFTHLGPLQFFMPPELAEEVAGHLTQHAREAKTGLILPPNRGGLTP